MSSLSRRGAQLAIGGSRAAVGGFTVNSAQTYGYDSVTQMQETKATLCKIWAA